VIEYLSLPLTDEVFSWNDPDGGPTLHFAVTRLFAAVAYTFPLKRVPIEREFATYCVHQRGVESARLAYWRKRVESVDCPPLLFCHFEKDDSHLLVDGTHRYVAAYLKQVDSLLAFIVPEKVWRQYLIIDLPSESDEKILSTPSGL
jgi:hypothetical protein